MSNRWLLTISLFACFLSANADESSSLFGPRITIQFQIVSVSMESAIKLAPALNDERRSKEALRIIQQNIANGRASLLVSEKTDTVDGGIARTSTCFEHHYPTETPLPIGPGFQQPMLFLSQPAVHLWINYFESRDVGYTLEVESANTVDGQDIYLKLTAESVSLIAYRRINIPADKDGMEGRLQLPLYHTAKTTTKLTAPNGRWMLLSMHKQSAPAEGFDLFLIRATARKPGIQPLKTTKP